MESTSIGLEEFQKLTNPKLEVICKYAIICPVLDRCAHGKSHHPLFHGKEYSKCEHLAFIKRNCSTYIDIFAGCPKDIPEDRECICINEEEVARALAKKWV